MVAGEIYLQLLNTHTLRLCSQLAARGLCITPFAHVVVVHIVEVGLCQGDEALKIVLVLRLHIGNSQASGILLTDHSTETGFALHDAIWHPTRLAQARGHTTISIGSTSCAMTTSFAFLSSMRVVTWLSPIFTAVGFFAAPLPPLATF